MNLWKPPWPLEKLQLLSHVTEKFVLCCLFKWGKTSEKRWFCKSLVYFSHCLCSALTYCSSFFAFLLLKFTLSKYSHFKYIQASYKSPFHLSTPIHSYCRHKCLFSTAMSDVSKLSIFDESRIKIYFQPLISILKSQNMATMRSFGEDPLR